MKQKMSDYRSRLLENPEYAVEAAKGDFIMDVTESICEILEKEGISRQQLAGRIGRSKGFVSQVLNGARNMTLATLAEIAHALKYSPSIRFQKKDGEKMFLDYGEVNMESEECIYETQARTKVA